MLHYRIYGPEPVRFAVVHGGPGALGDLADLAQELVRRTGLGVLEPLQTRDSVSALKEELAECLAGPGQNGPLILIGHSWGAWLAALTAEQYPERVEKLILVGCGPLRDGFRVDTVRESRFTPEIAREYAEILDRLQRGEGNRMNLLERLGSMCEKADSWNPTDSPRPPLVKFDGDQFAKVWPEAAELRRSGELERIFRRLRVPILVVQGDYDPHPMAGIRDVLSAGNIPCSFHLLPSCGHTPWRECEARESFFKLIADGLSEI